jgi:NAD(P)-dependent dehydrogenase (short-subunit alcohol dehydrogenase family)
METKMCYVLITGASSGIGRNLAINLSQSYNIVLLARNHERLLETKSLCSRNNDQLILELDLVKTDEIEKTMSSFIQEKNIEISHFVHCAGFLKMLPLKMLSLDIINSTFSTNTISAILLSKVLSQKKTNNAALKNIVFISSNISNFGAKAFCVYAASKSALDSVMRCLAVELAPKVRVNSVLPGAVQTEMTGNIFENQEVIDRMTLTYPLGIGRSQDIFDLVEFLLSEKSRWITGQQFTIDGGRTINISG